ncbi:DUF1015 domain-containing protein [bacterium]|nr:DUF1015 domain-containing protein [bacterium]
MSIEVKPLNAIVYNQEKVKMTDVIAPPYDVISDDYRDELEKRSAYNVVKLILANNNTDINDENNRYNEAYKNYQKWLEDGILVKTDKPCILYVIQNYEKNGKKITRKGFIARNRIEDFANKNILPHEYTMGGPKEDRLNLTKKCKANFSQVFLVYSDPEKQIENAIDYTQTPFIDVTDDLGVQNIVYKIDDEKTIELIEKVLSDKTCLIADGHHRYETAMNYRNYINSSDNNDATNYVMSYFTNMEDDLLIFPTHRILTKWVEPYVLIEKVKKYFDVEDYTFDGTNKNEVKAKFLQAIEDESKKQISMGLYMKNVNKFYLLKLRENVDEILNEYEVPEVLKTLDLIVLHKVIISKELGYTQEEQMAQDGILYIKQESEAFDMIDLGKAEASFIMAYPKIQDIKRISEAGERMPQKSTYFYPKLLSGIVINPLD